MLLLTRRIDDIYRPDCRHFTPFFDDVSLSLSLSLSPCVTCSRTVMGPASKIIVCIKQSTVPFVCVFAPVSGPAPSFRERSRPRGDSPGDELTVKPGGCWPNTTAPSP